MLVALADTHADGDPPLTDHLRETVGEADAVLHAGDFTAPGTLAAFERLTDGTGTAFHAVYGNADAAAVRGHLPAIRTVDALGSRLLLVHGHDHDRTALSLLARQEGADAAVVGHTHRPGVTEVGGLTVVNPGSHADPRGGRAAYARLDRAAEGLDVQLRTPAGTRL